MIERLYCGRARSLVSVDKELDEILSDRRDEGPIRTREREFTAADSALETD